MRDYLTVDGRKISKSAGNAAHPAQIADRYSVDALRWWLVRDVPPNGDADFREQLLVARANELADDLGNLVHRTTPLAARNRPRADAQNVDPPQEEARLLTERCVALPAAIDDALRDFDLRAGSGALWDVVAVANRFVSATEPWRLAKQARAGDIAAGARLDAVLGALIAACRLVAEELDPLLPDAAARIRAAIASADPQHSRTLFAKFDPVTNEWLSRCSTRVRRPVRQVRSP